MPIDWQAPLPKRGTEDVNWARENNLCPIATVDWYRTPQLFDLAIDILGGSVYNYNSHTRRSLDRGMAHACTVWQDKYMCACSKERMETCVALLEDAFASAKRYKPRKPLPYLLTILRLAINHEVTHEAQKAHVPEAKPIFDSVFNPI